jgi:hypothetical protein
MRRTARPITGDDHIARNPHRLLGVRAWPAARGRSTPV